MSDLPFSSSDNFSFDAGTWRSPGTSHSQKRFIDLVRASAFDGMEVPVRRWHVRELIPAGTVTIVNGDGGTGKSLLITQLALATTSNTPWISREVAQGPCIYLSAEDDLDELHRRIVAIAESAGVPLTRLDDLHIVPLAGEDALLAAPKPGSNVLTTTLLFESIEEAIKEEQPALVVLDTLADLFGGEENQRSQARQFVGLLRGWAIKHHTTIVLLAHPSLSGMANGSGSSGNTAWNNSVRSRLYLERVITKDDNKVFEPDPDARVLRTVKANYGRVGGEIALRWVDGVLEAKAQPAISSLAQMSAENRADQIFLSLLARFEAEGRRVSPTPAAPTYAPSYFAKHAGAEGITKRGLEAAMNRLFTAGKIRVAKSPGPPSKQTDIVVFSRGDGQHD
ncbi:AAA family ATPase [Devosia sp. 1566]|uniref:AAA family ATPase n=1 Tax=Devosia sp. 1566 TaxID=2499144 RepID=UPI000FDC51C8|nr:AAA family ATPase [Devosia sp. 1566]